MRRRLILAFAVLALLAFCGLVWSRPWLAVGILFLSHVLLFFPTMVANCQWWGPVITRFETPRREVWLTIDDGPDAIHTPRLLELLAKFEAKATFFVIGQRMEKLPNEIAQIRAAGHELGNHTCSHPGGTFWAYPPGRMAPEIDRHPLRVPHFRAPAGLKNFFLHPILVRRGMQLIGWTVRGLDTMSKDPAAVTARLRRGLKPGAILLLHEGQRIETEPDFHPRCLELTLTMLAEEGYRCVLPHPEQLRVGGR